MTEQEPIELIDETLEEDERRRRRGGAFWFNRRMALSGLAIIAVGSLGVGGTWSAWTAIDENADNDFSTTTLLISDNQGGQDGRRSKLTGTALFNVTNLEPGSADVERCIGIDIEYSAGATPTLDVKAELTGDVDLATQLDVVRAEYNTSGNVVTGADADPEVDATNTNNGGCADYPAGGTNTAVGPQGGPLSTWADGSSYGITSPVTNTWYRFRVSGLPTGTSCQSYCDKSVTMKITWTLSATGGAA